MSIYPSGRTDHAHPHRYPPLSYVDTCRSSYTCLLFSAYLSVCSLSIYLFSSYPICDLPYAGHTIGMYVHLTKRRLPSSSFFPPPPPPLVVSRCMASHPYSPVIHRMTDDFHVVLLDSLGKLSRGQHRGTEEIAISIAFQWPKHLQEKQKARRQERVKERNLERN